MASEDDLNVMPDLVLSFIGNSDDDQVIVSRSDTPTFSGRPSQEVLGCHPSVHLTSKANNKHGDQSMKMETRPTPRGKMSKQKQPEKHSILRPCEQHTFLTDITEVRQMEQGLLKLLEDFHSGKLQAFGIDCTFEKMEQVREQQERLARLHFELNAQQEMYGPQSEDGRRVGRENLGKLIENLQQLSHSIEQLQISSPSLQTDV